MFRVSIRTLLGLFGVAVILGLVALWAGWTYRFKILEQRIAVSQPFDAVPVPPAPDYDDPANWAAWPGRPGYAGLIPHNLEALPNADRTADVFYIHATTLSRPSQWNADVSDAPLNRTTDQLYLARHASAFNSCCRIFAPRWRQATLFASRRYNDDSFAAMSVAYSDIERAFDRFLVEIGDRPFIIASHSQGSAHIERLLAEKVSGTALTDRLVAVYMLGYWTPEAVQQKAFPDIPWCESATQTGCAIGFDTFGEGRKPFKKVDAVGHWDGERYQNIWPDKRICINPLSWQKDGGAVEASANKGALPVNYDMARTIGSDVKDLPDLLAGYTGAECRDGKLMVPTESSGVFKYKMTMPSYHRFDWGFFYGNIWANAKARTDAWTMAH